jgi:predicted DsbA family dithiol-disulfide isomerase
VPVVLRWQAEARGSDSNLQGATSGLERRIPYILDALLPQPRLAQSRYVQYNEICCTTQRPAQPPNNYIGVDKTRSYQNKFGNERADLIFERLINAGREVGINFNFGGKTGNTRDSHRLVQLGKSKSSAIETRMVEELFAAYFEQEGDITDHEVLKNAAVRAGLDEKEVVAWLKSDNGGKAVDEEVAQAQQNQIGGVPNFTIQGKYEVGGAQDPEVFIRLFEKIKAAEGAKA